MKKTIIALMALAGVAFGTEYTQETVWTLNFGSEYTNGYSFSGTPEKTGTIWDVVPTEGGTQTHASKRVHMAGGVYGSWDEDFVFTLNLTLGNADGAITASNGWPVFATIQGSGTALRFGPYTNMNNTVAVDGDLTKGDNNLVSVAAGQSYTLTLTKIGNTVTVAVNGEVSGVGTLADSVTGNITDIALGGDTGSSYRINETVHSVSWTKLTAVPEPTTATLSLLALAGLAARRRRK